MAIRSERRHYSSEERAHGLTRTLAIGPTAAFRELGIPVSTLAAWTYAAAKATVADAAPVQGSKPGMTVSGSEPRSVPTLAQPKASPGSKTSTPATTAPLATAQLAATVQPDGAVANPPASSPHRKGAAVHVAKSYTPSQRAQALERVDREGISKVSRELGISRFSLRDWRRKQALYADGKRPQSPLAGTDMPPKDERDRRILEEWRSHPGLGPSQVRNQLRRAGFKVSVHTVRVVLDANGYVAPKVRRSELHDRRYEAVRPNQLWHLDFLHRYVNKHLVYTLLMVDDFSRYIVGSWLDDAERADGVIATFEQAVARHGRPESVMSDGGSGFWSWRGVSRFTRLLEEYSVDHLVAKVPQTNGKIEVLNANIQKELFNVERFFDLGETQRRLETWVEFYNLRRTHHALGGILVPADRYFGRAERVLAELEAGRPAEGIGAPLPVEARLLDILKVTSQRGELEVHLMGRRLWPPVG